MDVSWERIKDGLDKALEVARKSAKIITAKAGETAKITKLSVEVMTLEHQMSKKFAELGNIAYRSLKSKKEGNLLSQAKAKKIVEETKKIEAKLNKVQKDLEEEKKRR